MIRRVPLPPQPILIAAAILTAGCVSVSLSVPPEPPAELAAVTAGVAALPRPPRRPDLPLVATPQAFAPSPRMLMGLAPTQVVQLVGAPTAVREATPATVWVYHGDECLFEVFLYPEVSTRELRALGYAVQGGTTSATAKQECFKAVWLARAA